MIHAIIEMHEFAAHAKHTKKLSYITHERCYIVNKDVKKLEEIIAKLYGKISLPSQKGVLK